MRKPYSEMTKYCALCQTSFTAANSTKDHVIPNAIGGRKKVRNFICRRCNSKTGAKWDSELAKQLQPFSTMLNVRRERRGNQPIAVETVSGRKLTWNPDGLLTSYKPTFDQRVENDKTLITIEARSTTDLRRILTDLEQTHSEIDVEKLISQASLEEEYLQEPLQISHTFGGTLAGRSIIKSCLALAFDAGLSISDCEHAKEYLVLDGQACFGYYNVTDPIVRRPDNTPLHCVYICANGVTGLVLAYAEYFGFQKIVACLSSNYSGPTLQNCYAVNPLTGEQLDIEVVLDLTKKDITAIYDYKKLDNERTTADLKNTLAVWYKNDQDRAINRAVDDAIEYAFSQMNLPSEEFVPEDRISEFSNLVLRKIVPLLLHLRFGRAFTLEELTRVDNVLS